MTSTPWGSSGSSRQSARPRSTSGFIRRHLGDVRRPFPALERDDRVPTEIPIRRGQGVCALARCHYRGAYGLDAANGILFNHEGKRRGETFLSRKVSRAVARIIAGKQSHTYLGNLDAKRDWGYAKDYMRAMWMMLQADKPDDYVIGTGESYTVREFCESAFAVVGLRSEPFIKIDPAYFRPTEVDHLRTDPSMAHEKLGWKPETTFPELVT